MDDENDNPYLAYGRWKGLAEAFVIKMTSDLMCVIGWTIGWTIILWDQFRGKRMKHPIYFAKGWEGHEGDGRSW